MNDNVMTLLDRVRETAVRMGDMAGVTARYAGKYAGQMVDVAKLNMRIYDLNSESNELLQEIGRMVYDTHRGQEPRADAISGLLARLDEKNAEIGQFKDRIAALRSGRECQACGALCGSEDKYCRDCGAAL